ncbi:MAG: BlaI/MecI/CopY family transcriptional regulator [Hymenobacter sp.]|nr:MAG: BlaI/MecI/CopY family transcriptional regulator [Hymenobacter sp.]
MQELTKVEEGIMQPLWDLKQAFVKDIVERLPANPKPPYTTVSSVVRILVQKGYVGFKAYGKTHEYFPLISRAQYRAEVLKQLLTVHFGNSPSALVSYLVEEVLNRKEIQQLRKLLDEE